MKDNEVLDQQQIEDEPKWDYTSSRETMITGAAVVGANLLVVIFVVLYKYVPAVHQWISGKPI
tara:strand:+ start:302 stop:490 length:189 start_codon:yes stop_codon:yes gene_type:complete